MSANIAEAFARTSLQDRPNRLLIARDEAEEAIKHLRANLNCTRIRAAEY